VGEWVREDEPLVFCGKCGWQLLHLGLTLIRLLRLLRSTEYNINRQFAGSP
jgi:hypothetical protein